MELGNLRDTHYSEGSEDWQKYTLEIKKNQDKSLEDETKQLETARDKRFKDLKYNLDMGRITERNTTKAWKP